MKKLLRKLMLRLPEVKMIKLKDIRVGSKVVVKGGFGMEPPKTVIVEGLDPDIKNGQAGIDYTDSVQGGRWAYLNQVVRVIEY